MTTIVSNFLKVLKSKPPTSWSIGELEDHAYAIQYIYMYTDDKEDMKILNEIYPKVVNTINNQRKGTMINPGFLINIDNKRK